jgi:hypothetical protein
MLTGSDTENLIRCVELSNEFIANNGSEGYHLALHSDGGHYATGASGLYLTENGKNFITPVFNQISALTPWEDVGILYRSDLYELNKTIAYAGLIEVSFHDIMEEAVWIHTKVNEIADAIASGIYIALGLERPSVETVDEWKQKYDNLLNDLQALLNKYK